MNLDALASQISNLDESLTHSASKAVNTLLTARNWLIGFYIVEYEHSGQDRAAYGESITKELANRLNQPRLNARNLWLFRQFYLTYPQIGPALLSLSSNFDLSPYASDEPSEQKVYSLSTLFENAVHVQESPNSTPQVPGDKLLEKLSFTHFRALATIDDSTKRTFYEIETIKGTWSVRELKRQIASQYYERSGMSASPAELSRITQEKGDPANLNPRLVTKDLYTFEFLGLPLHLAVEESDLETALLDHLSEFLLELGHGFCFEARQKRLLIGDEYFFVDLVFYHRILKCHVLVELKVGEFSHENAGQLNAYLNYYRKEVMEDGDNPPVGLLLVAEKNHALVEYATAGMDENLFVKKYLLELPEPERIKQFIEDELEQL